MKKYIWLFLLIFVFSFSFADAKLFSIKTECPFKTENLSVDSTNYDSDEIFQLQFLLSLDTSVYPEGLVTGKYGELTKKAVEKFQEKNDLTVTGIVDGDTQEKMCEKYLEMECPFVDDFKKNDEDKDNQILLMQQFLFEKNETADGVFDDVTETVLKKFKVNYGLGKDGVFDEKTRMFMCSSLGFNKSVSGSDIGIRINVDLSKVCDADGLIKIFEYNAGKKDAPVHKISVYVTYPNNKREVVFQGADLLALGSMQEKAYLLPLKGVKNGKVEIILDENNLLNEENLENNIFYFDLDCPNNDYVDTEKETEEKEKEESEKTNFQYSPNKNTKTNNTYTPKTHTPSVETPSNSKGSDLPENNGESYSNWGNTVKIDAPSRSTGYGSVYFNAYPNDVNKLNHGGGIVQTCYRAAPHSVDFVSNQDGVMDFGDGFKANYNHPGDGYYPVKHTYTKAGVYCPRFTATGESSSIPLTCAFAHSEENRTGCLIVFNQEWNNPPFGGTQGEQGYNIVPPCFSTGASGDKSYEDEPVYCTANYLVKKDSFSSDKSSYTTGEEVKLSWYIDNTDKNSHGKTIKDCPLLCNLNIDGKDNYIPYCSITGPYTFSGFTTPGKHTVSLGISGIKDQTPYDFCSWSEPLVLEVTGEAIEGEGVIVELAEMEELGVDGDMANSLSVSSFNDLLSNSALQNTSNLLSDNSFNFNSMFNNVDLNSMFNNFNLSNSFNNSIDLSSAFNSFDLSSAFNNSSLDSFDFSSAFNNSSLDSFDFSSAWNNDSFDFSSSFNNSSLDSFNFSPSWNNDSLKSFDFSGFNLNNTGTTNFSGFNNFNSLNSFQFDF